MRAPFTCRNVHCDRHAVVVNLEVQLGEGIFEGRYLVWDNDACTGCGRELEPVTPARELARQMRSA